MLHVLSHPLANHWLAELRDAQTKPADFRRVLGSLSTALFLEASRDLTTVPRTVTTPLAETVGRALPASPVLIPILRAGLGMVEPILSLLPEARVCHLGMFRDHATLEPVSYYLPSAADIAGREAFVLDPMLGTGGSSIAALELVKSWGVRSLRLVCVLGSRPGVERVRAAHPDVPIYLAALDEQLSDIGYIVPGLGDAGDRQFGG